MKKRAVLLVLILVLVMTLSSCIRMEANIKIHITGKCDFYFLYAISEDLGSASDIISDSKIEEYENEGFEVEMYEDDGYSGFVVSKKNCTPGDLSSDYSESSYTDTALNMLSNLEKNNGVVTVDYDLGDDFESISKLKNLIDKYDGYVRLVVTLPIKVEDHNATEISQDGKNLTWDLLDSESDGRIYFRFNIVKFIVKGIIIAACVIAALVLLIVIISKKVKRIKAERNNVEKTEDNMVVGSENGSAENNELRAEDNNTAEAPLENGTESNDTEGNN